MDTPEKTTTQITTPLSKFEDSPVFNYINSLSPIKPVRSLHVAQAFHSLSFSSVPSIFTSPHVSSHKESRFLRRNNYTDASKPEFSSENGNKGCGGEVVTVDAAAQLYENSAELQENFDPRVSVGEPPNEHMKFALELPRTLKYDCDSPECDSTTRCGTQSGCLSELAGTSGSLVPLVMEAGQKGSSQGETSAEGIHQIEEKTEAAECDWESLISDAADLLIFNSPVDPEAFKGLMLKSVDPNAGFCASYNNMQEMQIIYPISSGEQHEMEDPSTQPGETIGLNQMNQVEENLDSNSKQNKCITSHPTEDVDNEAQTSMGVTYKTISNLHRGVRRRCLDFEMVGARRKNLDEASGSSSSVLENSNERTASTERSLVPIQIGSDSSRRSLPGIGLHLNALALTSKENKPIKHENLSSGMTLPSSAASFHSPSMGQELHDSLSLVPAERDMDPTENIASMAEDPSQASAYIASEELNQTSPRKKRHVLHKISLKRRLEGETEGCKRCNCKKSKCLKLYCECFAAGVYCIEPCSCQECFNKPIHEDTVLATRKQIESRNPLAFAPKVIRGSDTIPEIGDDSTKTPASARHKRGCNCKKSSCLKKYCECYQGGVGCSINCRCEGCKNAFGRKDGSAPIEMEGEVEDETEANERSGIGMISQKTSIQNNEEQTPNTKLPTTPLRLCRPLVQLPLSSTSKPPRSLLGIGSSSGSYVGQKYGKPNIIRPMTKFEKQYQSIPDDDIPDILQSNCSPTVGVKTSSPNSKRVSPPHINLGSSPGIRSGRKLILQSIPSFPSLTPHH
ncbi:hypothetical protein Tsubulata_024928 [Turnera subulata]|uniref:CRC domain-containing protein n=1 Tax=Turnera subulata TaxID=218843 RepID=A0A9Q0G3L9_9ROSI|nr:hypothetical protein Tsubulata_024928 [Turnera subulata]